MDSKTAVIEVLDRDAIQSGKLEQFIYLPINPTEYTLNKSAQIAEINIPGLDSPLLQFVRGQNEKLTLELFFDTTLQGMGETAVDVRKQTGPFYQLVKIQPKTHAPPRIKLTWGTLSFKAIVESVQQKFELFNPKGIPLRASLSITFREYKTLEEQLKELNRQSADHTKQRIVQQGENLSLIAFQEYADARFWRYLAAQNRISDPRRLVPGTVLMIPPLDSFAQPIVEA